MKFSVPLRSVRCYGLCRYDLEINVAIRFFVYYNTIAVFVIFRSSIEIQKHEIMISAGSLPRMWTIAILVIN